MTKSEFLDEETPNKVRLSLLQSIIPTLGSDWYIALHGDSSWELDALEPALLADTLTRAINIYKDWDEWENAVEREKEMRSELKAMADNYRNNHKES